MPIKIDNYQLLYFSCCFKGKSALPLINEKVEVVSSCVKNKMDLKTVDQKQLDLGASSSLSLSGITDIL